MQQSRNCLAHYQGYSKGDYSGTHLICCFILSYWENILIHPCSTFSICVVRLRGWDGWMALLTRWTWVWANSGRWWRTRKPRMLQSMGLQRTRLDLMKWSELKVAQLCLTLCNPKDCTVHGILQTRILECVAFYFSRGSSQPRDRTQVSLIAGGFFTSWATRKDP